MKLPQFPGMSEEGKEWSCMCFLWLIAQKIVSKLHKKSEQGETWQKQNMMGIGKLFSKYSLIRNLKKLRKM